MPDYEVPEPILNSPYEEPAEHWNIEEGASPEKRAGRRPAGYFYRDPKAPPRDDEHAARGTWQELKLVNLIRQQVKEWRAQAYPGVIRTTLDLLNYWRRDGRRHRLFFAQLEAAETIIFLTEARADFRQGIDVPVDEPSDEGKERGLKAFQRYALKMATGTGKTTVMGMLAAWSILNKVNDHSDGRFSDDERAEVKAQAAQKWVEAVNADGAYGKWAYALARKPSEVARFILASAKEMEPERCCAGAD